MSRMRDILDWADGSLSEVEIQFLSEEAAEKVFLDPNSIDLIGEYQRLNKEIYDGKLGAYPMRWNRKKRSGALVKYRRIRNGSQTELKIVDIEVSTHSEFTHKALRDRLAHEMIHVYWLEKGVEYGHDHHFASEMRRINALPFGLKVTVKEEYEDPELKMRDKGRMYGVFILMNRDMAEGVFLVPMNKIKDMALNLLAALPRYNKYRDSGKAEIFAYDAGWLDKFRTRRVPTDRTLPGYQLVKPLELLEIRERGQYLGVVDANGYEHGGKNPYA